MKLYHYWRSSSSWRVRWALEHKGIAYESVHVNLLDDETDSPEHRARNPLGFVPVLEVNGKQYLTQSSAILEWLDEMYPENPLYPGPAWERAQIRELSQIICADTQPLQNLSPTEFHSSDAAEKKRWMQHWIVNGLTAYEKLASRFAGPYSYGAFVTAADLFLVPQVYNAIRQEIDLKPFQKVHATYENCLKLKTCKQSHPDQFAPK